MVKLTNKAGVEVKEVAIVKLKEEEGPQVEVDLPSRMLIEEVGTGVSTTKRKSTAGIQLLGLSLKPSKKASFNLVQFDKSTANTRILSFHL